MNRDEMTPEQLAAAMAAYRKRNDEEELRLRGGYSNPVPLEEVAPPPPKPYTGMLSPNQKPYTPEKKMSVEDLVKNPLPNSWEGGYVDLLGELESTKEHKDKAGILTAPYGITAAAGLKKRKTETDRDFAERAVSEYKVKAKKKLGDSWEELSPASQMLATDVMFNAGSKAPKFYQSLKDGDIKQALTETLDIVSSLEKDSGTKKVYIGLAKRRSVLYNKVAEEQNLPQITEVVMQEVDGKTYLKYLRGDAPPLTVKINKPAAGNLKRIAVPGAVPTDKKGPFFG